MIVFQSVCAVFVVPNIWKKAKLRKYCSQIFHIWNNSRLSTPFPVLNVFHCFRKSLPNQIDASHVSLLQKDFPTPPLPSEVGWVPLPIAFWFGSAVTCCKRHLKGVSHLWGESKLTPTGQQRLPEGETLLPQTTNLPLSHGGTFHCQPSAIASLFSSPPPDLLSGPSPPVDWCDVDDGDHWSWSWTMRVRGPPSRRLGGIQHHSPFCASRPD